MVKGWKADRGKVAKSSLSLPKQAIPFGDSLFLFQHSVRRSSLVLDEFRVASRSAQGVGNSKLI
jgi:hypothetical protein